MLYRHYLKMYWSNIDENYADANHDTEFLSNIFLPIQHFLCQMCQH